MDECTMEKQMVKEFELSGSEIGLTKNAQYGHPYPTCTNNSKTLELVLEDEFKFNFYLAITNYATESTSAVCLVVSTAPVKVWKSRVIKFSFHKVGNTANLGEVMLGSGSMTIGYNYSDTKSVPVIFPNQWRYVQDQGYYWQNLKLKLVLQYPIFPNSLQNPRCLDYPKVPLKFSISTPSTIASNITKNLTQEDLKALSDVEIVCNEETLPGHSFLMAATCKVFREKFTIPEEGNKKVMLEDVNPNIMKKLYDFMLNDQLKDLDLNEVEDLLKLSVRFEFTSLHDACAQVLINGLSKSNAVLKLHFALKFRSPALEKEAKKIVLSDMAKLAATKDFTLLMSDFPDAFQKSSQ